MKIDYVYATLSVVAWIATLLAICKLNEIKTRSGLAQATIVTEATAEQRRKDAAMSCAEPPNARRPHHRLRATAPERATPDGA